MRFIPTRAHGVLDYLTAILLMAMPWALGLGDGGLETWLPVALGAGVVLYSLLTRYELGVAKIIPMPVHLGLDVAGGALLAASPWVFGFSERAQFPYLIVGIFEIVVALVSQSAPGREPRAASGRLA